VQTNTNFSAAILEKPRVMDAARVYATVIVAQN